MAERNVMNIGILEVGAGDNHIRITAMTTAEATALATSSQDAEYPIGSVIWYTDPAAGGAPGVVKTAAATWKAMANIAA